MQSKPSRARSTLRVTPSQRRELFKKSAFFEWNRTPAFKQPAHYQINSSWYSRNYFKLNAFNELVLKKIKKPKKFKVLSVGIGEHTRVENGGKLTKSSGTEPFELSQLLNLNKIPHTITAIDAGRRVLKTAKQTKPDLRIPEFERVHSDGPVYARAKPSTKSIHFVQGRSTHPPVRKNSQNLIVCFHVKHYETPEGNKLALAEFVDSLKTGGHLVTDLVGQVLKDTGLKPSNFGLEPVNEVLGIYKKVTKAQLVPLKK